MENGDRNETDAIDGTSVIDPTAGISVERGIGNSIGTDSRNDVGTVDGEQPRRRRGRPPGSRNKSTTAEPEKEIDVSQAEPVRRTRRTNKAAKEEDARTTAQVIVMMLNTVAMNIAGAEASMNSMERALIEPSFVRTLMNGGAQSERITQLIDPLALVIGMSMWGSRVLGIRQQNIKRANAGYETMPPSEPNTNLDSEMPPNIVPMVGNVGSISELTGEM